MSFSGEIKEELAVQYAKARHCNLAELSAILGICGEFAEDKNGICTLRFPGCKKMLYINEKNI